MRASGRLLNAKIDARKLAFISASGSHGVQQAKESHICPTVCIVTFTNYWKTNYKAKKSIFAEVAAKVTEVLADLILMAPPDEQSKLMADILANLGSFLLEKKESADPTRPRRSSH